MAAPDSWRVDLHSAGDHLALDLKRAEQQVHPVRDCTAEREEDGGDDAGGRPHLIHAMRTAARTRQSREAPATAKMCSRCDTVIVTAFSSEP